LFVERKPTVSYEVEPTPRPVSIAAILIFVSAGLGILSAVLTFINADEYDIKPNIVRLFALISAVLAVVLIVLAIRARQGYRSARNVIVVLEVVFIALALPTIPVSLLGIVLNAIVIYLLWFHPQSKEYFAE
jgi:hypothetical protein